MEGGKLLNVWMETVKGEKFTDREQVNYPRGWGGTGDDMAGCGKTNAN